MIILEKVVVAKAYIAKYGSKIEQFDEATRAIYKNPQFKQL